MEKALKVEHILNTDSLLMREGFVLRITMEDNKIIWTSLTGKIIDESISKYLEDRYHSVFS